MRRRIIIALVAFLVLVGGGVLVLVLVNRSPKLQNAVYKISNTAPNTSPVKNTNTVVVQPLTTPDRQATVFVARNFVELFGSYSNQNKGSNLVEARAYATTAYAADLQTQANALKISPPAKEYNGIITKALVFTSVKLTAIQAQIVVSTQQTIISGTSTKTQSRDLLVDLLKVGKDWKVNAAVWK